MQGVLNVREPLVVNGQTIAGDGCADDTEAIQARLDALRRRGAQPQTCAETGRPDTWPAYASAVYFPAGVYRITSRIIMAQGAAEVTLEGVRALPHDVNDPDPNRGGFIPLVGDAYLLYGREDAQENTPTFRLVGRPEMPVYSEDSRRKWVGENVATGPYKLLSTYGDVVDVPQTAFVRAPETKATPTVALPGIGAHSVTPLRVPLPNASQGDVARVGLPADFPAMLMVTAVALDDEVELRIANPTAKDFEGAKDMRVVVAAGGGPRSGRPLVVLPDPVVPPFTGFQPNP